jgi:hypothetical protein
MIALESLVLSICMVDTYCSLWAFVGLALVQTQSLLGRNGQHLHLQL